MEKYALVVNGVVIQTQRSDDKGFIECPENVSCGMLYDGTIFSNPVVPAKNILDKFKKFKKREIRSAARVEIRKINSQIDIGNVVVCRWASGGLDLAKVHPKFITLIEIDRLTSIALKAVRQASTISEVDAVSLPDWP